MAFLQALGHLLGNAAHTVNNDIVKPVQRDVLHPIAQAAAPPVANGLVHLWQLANPNSGAQLPAQHTLQNLGNITPGIYPGVNNKPDWLESQQQGQ